jgi:hypothetical protein
MFDIDLTGTLEMKVLSLGWGVQSFTLAAMSALGDVERVDFAIHANTLHESQLTYDFISRWSPWFEEHNLQVFTVKNPMGVLEILKKPGQTHVPFFTLDQKGNAGQLNRSCTQRWKIAPMRRAIRAYLASQGTVNPKPGAVEQWIGISLDEFQRMRTSDVKYITNRWPLIEKKMTRHDCENWLIDHGLEVPPKSACTFCPFHSTAEWQRIKNNKQDWNEAVMVDRAFRHVRSGVPRKPVDVFVHPARKPLEEVDLRTENEKGQMSLWDEECSGMCGI